MCRPPAEAELMPDPSDTPTEAARLTDKKPDYSSLPAVTIGRRRREAIACDLARLSAMAVGGHCFKNALASLQPLLQLGAARYGALMAAIGAPGATVTPLLGGLAFDAHPRRAAIVFASVALLGGAICAGGLVQGSPAAVLAGGVVLGVGHGCLVVASRAIASERKEDQAYAQGVLAAFANLGAFVAAWKSTSLREPRRHRADAVTGTTSRRWRGTSTLSSRRSYGDNIASMAWGA